MKSVVLVALFVALSFSGCFGYPEGTVRPGDTITIRYEATDPATGDTVANVPSVEFVVGSGASGLGIEVERALVGHRLNETFTVESRDDESRAYVQEVTIPADLGPFEEVGSVSRSDFVANIGEPEVGQEFPLNVYQARVESFNEQNVTYRFILNGTQRDEFPTVGVALVSHIDGGEVVRRLEPLVGTTFTIFPPSFQTPSTPLGLQPGSYKTLGANDDEIIFGYNPSRDTRLLVEDLDIEVTIVAHMPGNHEAEPVDGNYGVREGTQVWGDRVTVGDSDDHAH